MGECAAMETPCPVALKSVHPLAFSADRHFCKCRSEACISGPSRCDGEVNCFDGSDEAGCVDAEAAIHAHKQHSDSPVTAPPSMPGPEVLRCMEFRKTEER